MLLPEINTAGELRVALELLRNLGFSEDRSTPSGGAGTYLTHAKLDIGIWLPFIAMPWKE